MNTTKLQTKTEKTTFEKFYQGWPHFQNLTVYDDKVVFILPNHKQAADSYALAQKRINDLCLPLKAELTGQLSNTFIVKEA